MTRAKKFKILARVLAIIFSLVIIGPIIVVFLIDASWELFRKFILRKKNLTKRSLILWFMDIFFVVPVGWLHKLSEGKLPHEDTDKYYR